MTSIQAINVGQGLALTDKGDVLEASTFIDTDGDECGADGDVFAMVVQIPDGRWATVFVSDFEKAIIQ